MLARDRGKYAIAYQHLVFPMIDDRTAIDPDVSPYAGEFIWTQASDLYGWTSLLNCAPGSREVSCYAAAARAEDLAGLPPTFIMCGALDLFLEESLEYARRLMRAGVPVEMHIYPGAPPGFQMVQTAVVSQQAVRDSTAALSKALRGTRHE